jgi:gluconate 2-dehydrogenase gamma chain
MSSDIATPGDAEALLTLEQQEILRAAIDRIIPADDYPGGWEAGVGDYLLRQLAGDLQPVLRSYREGLDELEAEAQVTFSTPFAVLTVEQQDLLLLRADFASETLRHPGLLQRFFRLLTGHTAEGYYSDPGNGGNHDRIAWQMIGFRIHEQAMESGEARNREAPAQ